MMSWESSRGSRRVGEWVNLLELCEQRSVSIHVVTRNRTYDPANGRDRRSLLEFSIRLFKYRDWRCSTEGITSRWAAR